MFLHHGIAGIEFDIGYLDVLLREDLAAAKARTLGAGEELTHAAGRIGDLAALAVNMDGITEVVIDAEEVEHVARVAPGAATEAEGADGRTAQEPDGDVDVMDVLLDDVVAGELRKVHPVAVHVDAIRITGGATTHPRYGAVPLYHPTANGADGTSVDEGLILQVRGIVTALRPGDDGQALGFGLLARGDDDAGTDGVDGDWLFDEAMLARFDRGGEMHWTEHGRRRHEDERAIRRHHLLVGVVTHEEFGRGQLVGLVDLLDTILERIGQRDDLGFNAEDLTGRDELRESAGATTTAPDEGDLNLSGHGSLSTQDARGSGQGESAEGHGGYEVATLDGVFHIFGILTIPDDSQPFSDMALPRGRVGTACQPSCLLR